MVHLITQSNILYDYILFIDIEIVIICRWLIFFYLKKSKDRYKTMWIFPQDGCIQYTGSLFILKKLQSTLKRQPTKSHMKFLKMYN